MNPRWREIAVTCWDERPDGLHFDQEMFAELIIRECADVCNNLDAEYEGEEVLATWCAKSIKEHFGLEE